MSKSIKQFFIFAVVASFSVASFVACNQGAGGATKDGAVAATVNGKNILLSEVDNIITQQSNGQQAQLSPLEQAAGRLQVLDNLVKQEAMFQRAEKEKTLPTDDEVTTFINSQKQQNRLSDEDYQKYLRDSNQTEQAVREQARKSLAIQKLQEKINSKISVPNDKEVDDFYNANKEAFVSEPGVSLAAIVVDPQDNKLGADDAKTPEEAAAKAQRIYAQLKTGGDFASVARANSENQNTREQGGDIGFWTDAKLKQSGFPPDLTARLLNALPVGNYTEPIRSGDGSLTIFKVTARQSKRENLTLDSPDVRNQIKERIMSQRRTLLSAALLEVALNEAKVTNNLADSMLNDPNTINNLRYAAPGTSASPVSSVAPAAAPTASASPSNKKQ